MTGGGPDGSYTANQSTTSLLPPSMRSHGQSVQAALAQAPQSLRRNHSMNESPYSVTASLGSPASLAPSISDKFSLSPDPSAWGADLSLNHSEPDDYLHNPDPKRDRKNDQGGNVFTYRGLANLGCLAILALGILTLFAGYPMISHFTQKPLSNQGGFNLGGINASGQVPRIPGNHGLIDLQTPDSAKTGKVSWVDGAPMQLVFSDEFNTDGRTFYPGDDPYWEAVNLHYWATNNLEWYDPAAITTSGGYLRVTLSQKQTHGLNYQGGMMTTWNKFCFTGGLIEASVQLPGLNDVVGLWPAIWTMGNLGRAGYGASLDGMWPYTYDSCDVGTAPNQTHNQLPLAALTEGDPNYGGTLSYLPGQRLSRCTCPGESHPGPVHSDGTYVGRAAPEIDIFEAQVSSQGIGQVSQSAQWAPFNGYYTWFNSSDNMIIPDPANTVLNSYKGSVYQQASSALSVANQGCYEKGATGCFAVYGFEYNPGFDNAYITWLNDNKVAWTLKSGGVAADTNVEISARPIPQEPLYIIINLGMSTNFGPVDFQHIPFPVTMSVDWIRVYQRTDSINIGCDPVGFPTQAYINEYLEAYLDSNLTTWKDDYKQPIPKSSFLGQC